MNIAPDFWNRPDIGPQNSNFRSMRITCRIMRKLLFYFLRRDLFLSLMKQKSSLISSNWEKLHSSPWENRRQRRFRPLNEKNFVPLFEKRKLVSLLEEKEGTRLSPFLSEKNSIPWLFLKRQSLHCYAMAFTFLIAYVSISLISHSYCLQSLN